MRVHDLCAWATLIGGFVGCLAGMLLFVLWGSSEPAFFYWWGIPFLGCILGGAFGAKRIAEKSTLRGIKPLSSYKIHPVILLMLDNGWEYYNSGSGDSE